MRTGVHLCLRRSGWRNRQDGKRISSYFRNPKAILAKVRGRQRLQEALDPVIKQMVAERSSCCAGKNWFSSMIPSLHQSLQHQASQLEERLKEAVAALNETLTSGVPAEEWHMSFNYKCSNSYTNNSIHVENVCICSSQKAPDRQGHTGSLFCPNNLKQREYSNI